MKPMPTEQNPDTRQGDDRDTVSLHPVCSAFDGPRVCQNCGCYARVRRRTVNQSWHVAEWGEWGECRKADLTKMGVMTGENETCADFTPDPRRWPNDPDQATARRKALI